MHMSFSPCTDLYFFANASCRRSIDSVRCQLSSPTISFDLKFIFCFAYSHDVSAYRFIARKKFPCLIHCDISFSSWGASSNTHTSTKTPIGSVRLKAFSINEVLESHIFSKSRGKKCSFEFGPAKSKPPAEPVA